MYEWARMVALVAPPPGAGGGIAGGIFGRLAALVGRSWFQYAAQVVGSLAHWAMTETWKSLSASTAPVLSGPAFRPEFQVMVVVAASVILPMLFVGIVQSIVRQDGSALLRSALIRTPFALVFTGVAVGLVSVCLSATDEASGALLSIAGDPARKLFNGLGTAIVGATVTQQGIGASLLVAGTMALVAFVLWVELAVRSAAVAAATLFLPLALAGLAWPATTHWARRLGETIAGLVLMKLVIAGVLALAAAALGHLGGVSEIVEGIALLGLATFTPFALLRLIPMIEAGAVAHLEGAHHRATGAAARLTRGETSGWLAGAGAFSSPEAPLGTEDVSESRALQRPGLQSPGSGAGGPRRANGGSGGPGGGTTNGPPGGVAGATGGAGGPGGGAPGGSGGPGGPGGGSGGPGGGAPGPVTGPGDAAPGSAGVWPAEPKYLEEIEAYKEKRHGAA
jgi:hypothetical protein